MIYEMCALGAAVLSGIVLGMIFRIRENNKLKNQNSIQYEEIRELKNVQKKVEKQNNFTYGMQLKATFDKAVSKNPHAKFTSRSEVLKDGSFDFYAYDQNLNQLILHVIIDCSNPCRTFYIQKQNSNVKKRPQEELFVFIIAMKEFFENYGKPKANAKSAS